MGGRAIHTPEGIGGAGGFGILIKDGVIAELESTQWLGMACTGIPCAKVWELFYQMSVLYRMRMHKVGPGISPSQSWHRDLASLIDHIRLRNFPEALNVTLRHLVDFDVNLTATYKHHYKPLVVLSTHPRQQSTPLAKYIDEFYILDPLFNAIQDGLGAGVYRLQEIAPDAFESTDYYRLCYREFDPADEIILMIPLDNDVVFTVSLGRQSSLGAITRSERNTLNSVFPVISALVRQFWIVQSAEYVHHEEGENSMAYALSTFGSGVLTKREQEITGLILQGHSSKAIATRHQRRDRQGPSPKHPYATRYLDPVGAVLAVPQPSLVSGGALILSLAESDRYRCGVVEAYPSRASCPEGIVRVIESIIQSGRAALAWILLGVPRPMVAVVMQYMAHDVVMSWSIKRRCYLMAVRLAIRLTGLCHDSPGALGPTTTMER